ncbi:probable aquaporin NIP7-1 [Olea europaea var. sylvestris]|uniref:probable aquaporin NIP7-1 n=1 Tax=Olea europaea var. sylvestris TaxID=158386 RepID=UPI000C1D7D0D|nr:probable aquaporin NIP7-1 [Olea europaea var. sylvestris]
MQQSMKAPFRELSSTPDILGSTATRSQPKNDLENGDSMLNETVFNSLHKIDKSLVRKVLAEALGTFVLMFCICAIIAIMHLIGLEAGLMEYAATAALTVTVIVFSIGAISGAHVNPAVTIAFATVGPFPWSEVPLYILAQIGGSTLATYIARLVYGIRSELVMTKPLQGCTAAFWVELIATFIILFLTASLSNDPQSIGQVSGFVVGVAIGLGVLISGPVSGGSMNPARSLGPALVSWKFDDHLWIYLVAPTIGAIAGVFVYRILRLQGWSCESSQARKGSDSLH